MKKISTSKTIRNKRATSIFGSFFVALLLTFSVNIVVGQNLITNGCFEAGGVGTGFQSDYSNGNFNTQSSVNVNTGATNSTVDNATYTNCADHTTGTLAGHALVVQGANYNNSGSKVYQAVPTGGIAVTNGATYTFTYWIESLTPANPADILVQFNGGAIVPTLVTGSATAPSTTCDWQQVTYSLVATSGFVQIALYNSTSTQSGFALDDISLTKALSATASSSSSICPQGTGTITAIGSGGRDSLTVADACGSQTPDYTYSDGGAYQSSATFSGLAPGTYTISIADGIGDTVQSNSVTIVAPPANPLSVSDDTTIDCSSSGVSLLASGGTGGYTWSPAIGLSSTNVANPTASYVDTSSITYIVSSGSPVGDAIVNGDFSAGNTGFTSQYSYIPNNSSYDQGAYSVTTKPSNFEPAGAPTYYSSCGGPTGTGNMLVADGSTTGQIIWSETVGVIPSATYTLTYWLQSVSDPSASPDSLETSPASIKTLINGSATSLSGTNPVTAPASMECGNWIEVTQTWTSGANTSATISLIDSNLVALGNDFAIDDISFTTSAPCPVTDSLVISYTCSLPIGLINFAATPEDKGKVLLNWNTASEQNSSMFIVQRSTDDGQSWINIDSVKAAGNSITDRAYTNVDDAPANGINYYRLQEVDLNGSYEYSSTQEVTMAIENTANAIKIFPNPTTTGLVQVTFPVMATQQKIQLINSIGQVVMQQSVGANIGMVNLDVSQLSQGMYVVRITNNQQVSYADLLIL